MSTPLTLHTLTPAPRRRRKRLGRGNASGRGTYAARGMKGQHARSGNKGIQARSLKSLFQRIPKHGGFRSLKEKAAVVTLDQLSKTFTAGAVVTPATLRRKHLVPERRSVKVLATGTMSHALTIKGCAVSAQAAAKITAAGGTITPASNA